MWGYTGLYTMSSACTEWVGWLIQVCLNADFAEEIWGRPEAGEHCLDRLGSSLKRLPRTPSPTGKGPGLKHQART